MDKTRRWFMDTVSSLEVVDRNGAKLIFKAWTPMEANSGRAMLNVMGLWVMHDKTMLIIKAYNPWV
jgi:hypothetical protein